MALSAGIDDRIQKLFDEKYKEYAAHDRTLSALAAFRFVLEYIPEINEETVSWSFRPRVCSRGSESNPRTPDGLIVQRPSYSFVLELKTSWNKGDVTQVTNYGKAEGYLQDDGALTRFQENHCILLGYQNVPGDSNLGALFDEWEKQKPPAVLVVFRYSFESAPTGDRMFFSRVPFARNGACPRSHLGRWINSARGFSVSAASFSRVKTQFHKSNDQVIDSYAAVIWYTDYARNYLSEEQLAEMAVGGRLQTPLQIPLNQIDKIPVPQDVEVPLTPSDVKKGLEFLRQAGLVTLNVRERAYEVKLRQDRYVRLPTGAAAIGASQEDIAVKIINRWATYTIKKPLTERPVGARRTKSRRYRDTGPTLPFPP
jgi:hypothetical protein